MKQDNYSCFLPQKPVMVTGPSRPARNCPPALSLLLSYYYATITLLVMAFSRRSACLLPASSYGVTYTLGTGPVLVL